MATTAYCALTGSADLGQIDPPYFTQTVTYTLIDAILNQAKLAQSTSQYSGQVTVNLTPPIASQAAVFVALQTAIQAAETNSPLITFIWLGA